MYGMHDLFKDIRKRPGMYLKKVSITQLELIYMGFWLSLQINNIPYENKSKKLFPLPFDYFNEFIICHYDTGSRALNSFSNILRINNYDEEKSFEIFFELYDKFMALDIEYCQEIVLDKKNIEYNFENLFVRYIICQEETGEFTESIPIYENPTEVYLVKIINKTGYLVLIKLNGILKSTGKIFASSQKAKKHIKSLFGDISDLKWKKVKDYSIFDNIWYK